MSRQQELAWAAGFYEGEGCCGVHKRRLPRHGAKLQIQVVQKQRWPLERLVELWGGRIYWRKPVKNWGGVWSWAVWGDKAEIVLRQLYPLVSPRRQDQIDDARAAVAMGLSMPEFLDWNVLGKDER